MYVCMYVCEIVPPLNKHFVYLLINPRLIALEEPPTITIKIPQLESHFVCFIVRV